MPSAMPSRSGMPSGLTSRPALSSISVMKPLLDASQRPSAQGGRKAISCRSTNSISIIIPVYNSQMCLQELYVRIKKVTEANKYNYEIIFVEDSGRDNSWGVITQLAAGDGNIRAIQLSKNFGQHNALLCGIRLARHDVIVTIDDDLQYSPEDIPKLLEQIANGFDVVYGVSHKKQHGIIRGLITYSVKMVLLRVMNIRGIRNISPFRAFKAGLVDVLDIYQGPFVSIDVLLSWGTDRFASIFVQHNPRYSGRTNYNVMRLLSYTFNLITGFSVLPLQFASLVGFLSMLFGIAMLFFVLIRFAIYGGVVPGFVFLASVTIIFSGTILFALGIYGEYLARLYYRVMQKPQYAVREKIDND